MKNIALLILGCIATPLILYSQLKGWHQRGEIFGFTVSPAIAQTASPVRQSLLKRAAKCPSKVDTKTLSDKALNDFVFDCERS